MIRRWLAVSHAVLLAGCCNVNSIRTQALPDGTVGQPYAAAMEHNCEDQASLDSTAWSLTGSLPPGVGFSGEGRFSGTPSAAGTYSLTISVATGDAFSNIRETRTFSLTIRP
jgi:hypothetical protein